MLPAEAHAEQQQTAAPPLAENEVVKAEAVETGANDAKLTEQDMNAMESNVKQDNAGYIDESLWENTEEDDLSDQWSSRWSFVLAAIGSAVGLGNFWRFPFQVYEYGGGTFFIPYLLALFFVGIPTMQLEMAVGQVFRRSALQSFGRLHPRMAGVGLAAAWFSFALVTYYVAILAWGNVMFIKSFYKDMPFSIRDVVANESRAPMDVINVPAGHFGDVILSGSPSTVIPKTISAGLMMGALFMWVTVWLILTKGQEFVSKAVWVTVLMPCFMLLLLLIVGATLEGAGVGIEKYLAEWDFSTLSDGGMWTDAFGQVFFSLSIAYGIMPAYASLNPRNSDIVKDAVIVSICDAVFSFFAGFAVFTIVGFFSVNSGFTIDQLGGKEPSIVDGEEVTLNVLGGATLAFVTYPAGLSLLNGYWANITCVMFFVTFFFLGVDSAFSLIEACVLTMRETVWFADWTKSNLTTLVVFVAAMCNLLFITDNGIYYLDFADVYIATLGVFLIGFLESLTAGWIFNKSMSKYKVGANAVNAFDGLFWTGLLLFIILGYQLPESTDLTQGAIYGVALGVGLVFIAAAFASVALLKPSSMSLGDAYYWACLHGVDSLKDMLNRTITKDRPKNWAFTRAWAISIKFLVCPTLFILLGTKTSGLVKSGGYDGGVSDPIADHFFGFFNFFGSLFIVVAIVCVLGSIIFPEKYNDVRTGVLALRRKNKENL